MTRPSPPPGPGGHTRPALVVFVLGGLAAAAIVVLVAFALAGDDAPTPQPVAGTATTATGIARPGAATPETYRVERTPVNASLEEPLGDPVGLESVLSADAVVADWYRWGNTYIVVYRGLDLAATGPVCLGAAIRRDPGGMTIAHAATPHDSGDDPCVTVPTDELAPAAGAARSCGSLVYLITDLPVSPGGELLAWVERHREDGTLSGRIGTLRHPPGGLPEFVPDLTAYHLPSAGEDDLDVVTC